VGFRGKRKVAGATLWRTVAIRRLIQQSIVPTAVPTFMARKKAPTANGWGLGIGGGGGN
jgi:hypothetical protein